MTSCLKEIADTICTGIHLTKHQLHTSPDITFVKAAERWPKQGLLASALHWQLKVDLGKQLKFPQHIVRTSVRPAMVLTSDSSKHVVIMGLTIPWKDSLEEVHGCKKNKKKWVEGQ